jgi:hypothetical protein
MIAGNKKGDRNEIDKRSGYKKPRTCHYNQTDEKQL